MSIDTNEINTEEVVAAEAPISTERFLTFTSDGLTIGISTDYVTDYHKPQHYCASISSRLCERYYQSSRTDHSYY